LNNKFQVYRCSVENVALGLFLPGENLG